MALKKISELTEEELQDILVMQFKFDIDEVKTLFRKEEDLRNAVRDAVAATRIKLSEKEESGIGWDSTDETILTKDQKEIVDRNQRNAEKLKKAKQRVAEQVDAAIMEHSLQQTGADLTVADMKQTRDDLKKLLAELDEEEDD